MMTRTTAISRRLDNTLRRSYENVASLGRPATPLLKPVDLSSPYDDLERSLILLDEPTTPAMEAVDSKRRISYGIPWMSHSSTIESFTSNEPLEFTARDIIALERKHKKLKKSQPSSKGWRHDRT